MADEAEKAPAASPQPEATVSPTPAPAAVADAPAVAETLPSPGPSLLAEFDAEKAAAKAEAAKPELAKPGDAAKPTDSAAKPLEDGKPAAEAAAPAPAAPVVNEWAYKLPDTIKLDDAGKTRINAMLDAFAANPKDPAAVQALADYHAERMEAHDKQLRREQHEAWVQTNKDWAAKTRSDPQIGGSGFKTAMAAIARMRDMFVPPNDRQEFNEMLASTGVGNHPAFLKAWHNAARFFDEPSYPSENAAPATGRGRAPGRRRLQDIYRAGAGAQS